MRKKMCTLMASTLALTAVLGSCGKPSGNGVVIDPNKTQVYVSVFNGGFGVEWLNVAVERFNSTHENAQVIVNTNKDIYQSQIVPAIKADVSPSDVFITAQASCSDLGIQGYLEDLSDIWAADVDGNGVTVAEKMDDPELYKKVYQTAGGTWGLPHSDAIQGFVYDHSIFADKGFLMTESDGVTLTKGKDGVSGTYDDGQPVTMSEWDEMLQRMVGAGVYPFMWTGMYATNYLTSLYEALYAQYEGMESYYTSFSYDGEYTHKDGTKETITPETGWKTIKTDTKKDVMEFINKYLVENSNYYHPSTQQTSVSHTDAQALYVLGYQNVQANPQSGMLYDGIWWENEARATFASLEKRGEREYKYGTRDYRYMLLPNKDGQRGANGDGTGSVIGVSDSGTIFLKKQSNADKRTYAKEFIKYLVSDEVSKLFLTHANGLRPYDLELTEDDRASMTKFAQNAYALYSDSKNVTTIRLQPLKYLSEMNYGITNVIERWGSNTPGRASNHCYTALCNFTVDEYYENMYSAEYWTTPYEQYLALK